MNGEGSIELKSWFMSRSFRLMVCAGARGPSRQCQIMKNAYETLCYQGFGGQAPSVPRPCRGSLTYRVCFSSSDRPSVSLGA